MYYIQKAYVLINKAGQVIGSLFSYILLENGDKIILEDDSGFLLMEE